MKQYVKILAKQNTGEHRSHDGVSPLPLHSSLGTTFFGSLKKLLILIFTVNQVIQYIIRKRYKIPCYITFDHIYPLKMMIWKFQYLHQKRMNDPNPLSVMLDLTWLNKEEQRNVASTSKWEVAGQLALINYTFSVQIVSYTHIHIYYTAAT